MIYQCCYCKGFWSEKRMANDTTCDQCEAGKSLDNGRRTANALVTPSVESKETAGGGRKGRPRGKGLPIASGERGNETNALMGQLSLQL
jgi:hypothetical protein